MSDEERQDSAPVDWPLTYRLLEPIHDLSGEPIQELVLQKPTLQRLRVLDQAKGRIDELIKLVARLSGLPEKVIGQLGPRDSAGLGERLADFFVSPPTSDS